MTRKVAVVLFNLGGPDSLQAVRPFLFNLFSDPAIIRAPGPIRLAIATLISLTRNRLAKANYSKMGGRSPILPETEAQARALEAALSAEPGTEARCFIAMRYWKPFAADAAAAIRAWAPEAEVVLIPLYPQYSTTTTASSLKSWKKVWDGPTRALCCYPAGEKFAKAHAARILEAWEAGGAPQKPRVLFSAHGLPQSVVDAGDPYQWQVEQSAAAVRALLPPEWETRVCYQSRVGPLKWLGPSTEEEIHQAGKDGAGLIVAPIAFVSEHVETLVELDDEYAALAKAAGVPYYLRAKAVGVSADFIAGLADQVRALLARPPGLCSETGARLCPAAHDACPLLGAAP